MNSYYDYIKAYIEGNLESHCKSFDCIGAILYDFVFNIAGFTSCVDVTLQSLADEIESFNFEECYTGVKKWGEEVKGEPLDNDEKEELIEVCFIHCGPLS